MNIEDIKFGDRIVFFSEDSFYPDAYVGTVCGYAHGHNYFFYEVLVESILYSKERDISKEGYQDLMRMQRYVIVDNLKKIIAVSAEEILLNLGRF